MQFKMHWKSMTMKINNDLDYVLKALDAIVENVMKGKDALDGVQPFPGSEKVGKLATSFEYALYKALIKQKKYYVSATKDYKSGSENEEHLKKFLQYATRELFPNDPFAAQAKKEADKFYELTIRELTKPVMKAIDDDVLFDGRISRKTNEWINKSSDLISNGMSKRTQASVRRIIKQAIRQGKKTNEVANALEKLPAFDRKRAERVARTEVLSAAEAAKQEAYLQSPIVEGKIWHHNTTTKAARESHKKLDGVFVAKDEMFNVDGHKAEFPRDIRLPAGHRVNCRCSMNPVINKESKRGLTKLQKLQMRDEFLIQNSKKK